MDPQFFPYFNICIVLSSDVKFREALRNGYRAADMIEHARRPYIEEMWFYLMKPHFALMYKVRVMHPNGIIDDPDEPEKARTLFDGSITALPIIEYRRDANKRIPKEDVMQNRQYTNSVWVEHLESKGTPYYIQDVVKKDPIIVFLKQQGIIPVTGASVNALP